MSIYLIHIAPELPPTVGGVADYAAILSRRLVEVSEGATEPVLVHAGREATEAVDVEFPLVDLSGQCSPSAIAEAVRHQKAATDDRVVVLLEYSGYGYSKRGAPFWLLRGLQRACGDQDILLITIFHELFATSYKPWDRRFWTMPAQYYVSSRLAHLSDGCMANWDAAAQWLGRQVNGQPVRMSPSFSNVGEPGALPDYSEREPYAVCFGGASRKEKMYRQYGDALSSVLRRYSIDRVVDLGSEPSEESYSRIHIPVHPKGVQAKESVSTQLRKASIGLLNYPLHCLKKSGIWGSYAAHGVPTVLTTKPAAISSLDRGEHFLLLDRTERFPALPRLAEIGDAAHRWYQEVAHSQRTAQRITRLIRSLIEGTACSPLLE